MRIQKYSNRERIYLVVGLIPYGKVATYGQIAKIIGCQPLFVGYALASLHNNCSIPWHRVVNRHGQVSIRNHGQSDTNQVIALQQENVCFDNQNRLDLAKHGWVGPCSDWLIEHGFDPIN